MTDRPSSSTPPSPLSRRKLLACGALALSGTALGGGAAVRFPALGRNPTGERLARCMASPHWRGGEDGAFQNLVPVRVEAGTKSKPHAILEFLFRSREGIVPKAPVPGMRTDLAHMPDGHLVWFGHSSFMIRAGGVTLLVNPAFGPAAPVGFVGAPFPMEVDYRAADLPCADAVLLTHDHYDHMEWETILTLAATGTRFVCPLGVGEHLELWDVAPERITELDWFDETTILGARVTLTPSQHFSGRTLTRDRTLWGGFIVETGSRRLWVSGDGELGPHFAEVRRTFGRIDLLMLEAGQYNAEWS